MIFSSILGNLNGSNEIKKYIDQKIGGESVDVEINPKVNEGVFSKVKKYYSDIFSADKKLTQSIGNAFDASKMDDYVDAISGLNKEQALLALSTQQLTDEQKEQILIQAGLITSEDTIQSELLQTALTQQGVDATRTESILIELGLMNAETSEMLAQKKCNREDLKALLAQKGLTEAQIEGITSTLGLTGANVGATASFKALAKSIASTTAALASSPIGWVGLFLAGIAVVEYQTSSAIDEIKSKAQELGDSFNDTKSDISEYKDQIADLHDTINDSTSSIEEVTTARQKLMTIQDELIEKFGDEKETVDLITQAIKGQSNALDTLTQKQWLATKNEFNKNDFWGNVANWRDQYEDNIDRMITEMEGEEVRGGYAYITGGIQMNTSDYYSKEYDNIIQKLENMGYEYNPSIGSFSKTFDNLEQKYEELLEIQALFGDGLPKESLKGLEDSANDAKEILDKYEDIWDSYILYERILPNEDLTNSWNKVNDAYNEYQKALVSGDNSLIEETFGQVATAITQVLNDENVDASVKSYFEDMYPAIRSEIEKWEFKINMLPQFEVYKGLQGKTRQDVIEMLSTDGIQDGENIFNSILASATDNGLVSGSDTQRVEQLIELLIEWGVLQGDINNSILKTKKSFEEVFNASSFKEQKEELLELARAGEISYEVLETTDEYKTLLDQTGLSAKEVKGEIMSLLTATELLAAASQGTEPLIDAYKEHLEKNFVTAETLEAMEDNYKELASWEDFKIIAGDPNTKKEEAQKAFNKLLTEWYIDQDILSGLTRENQEIHIANMEDDNIGNAREATEKYLKNQELFTKAAEEYNAYLKKGGQSYEDYLKDKGELDEGYFTSIGTAHVELFNLYSTHYGDDLKNYATLIANKMKLEARLNKVKKEYAQEVFKIGDKELKIDLNKNAIDNLKANGFTSDADIYNGNLAAMQNYLNALKHDQDKLAEIENEINDILYIGIKDILTVNDNKIKSDLGSNNTFDWIETRLAILNEELEDFKETAEDSFNGWEVRDDAFKNAKGKIKDLIEEQKKAKEEYLKEANDVGLTEISENGKSYVELIQSGEIDLETVTNEETIKKIQEYQDLWDKAKGCQDAIEQLNKDSLQLDRDYRSFRWEIFDYLKEQISRVTEEAEYLIGLLEEEDLFDDNGNMTKYADATLGLHISNMDTYKQFAKDDFEEIQKLQKEIDNGTADQETVDKYNELVDSHRDNINAMNDEKKAILDLVEEGYNKQLEALNKLIDKKKEAMNAEKDLYDYQKTVEEQSKKVSSLQRQYDVYKNDTSEEGKAQAQKLKVELEAAQEELEQTQYDKYLSDQEAMLDKLSADYEEWMNNRLDDENKLLTEISNKISGEGDSILSTLNDIATKNDTFISKDLETSVKDGVLESIDTHLGNLIDLFKGNPSFASALGNLPAHAKGTKRSGKGWAWTQEEGVELIRTKDGALLTPLDNSMVFNNESSRRLWEFSQNPVDYLNKLGIQDIAPQINMISPKLPDIARNVSSNPVINLGGINIVCNEVSNADEIVNDLISNKKFEKAMFSAVGNAMTGGNSLSKFRY